MYYLEQLKLFHAAFAKYGLNVDVIGQHEDISDYKIIAAPELYITDAGLVQKLSDFARKGGTVILTNRTGVKNENNNCIMEQLPTVYRKMTGAFVEEYNPIGYAQDTVQFSDGKIFQCRQWCDVLCPESAETIAEYANDFYIGKAAVTKNHFGNGTVYYIGTVGEKGFYYHLIKKILTETKLAFIEHLPDNVEITTRTEHQKTIQFLFNNTDKVQCFMFHNQEVTLQPFEMQILNHLN